MKIQVGNYILYPAFFAIIFGIFISILIIIVIKNVVKNKKHEKFINKYYEISKWQRKYLCSYLRKLIEEHDYDEMLYNYVDLLSQYMKNNKLWDLNKLLNIKDDFVPYITIMLFEISKSLYIDGDNDGAVLCLHTIDFMNGGMDNPDYFDGEYPWIGDEIPQQINNEEMSDEETRTLHLYISAVKDIYEYFDEDLEKIPESLQVDDFCKRLKTEDIFNACNDLYEIIDILEISDETRDVVIKALFNSLSVLIGSIFDNEDENYVEYLDEYRRYQLRALISAIDKQLYSDVIASIE